MRIGSAVTRSRGHAETAIEHCATARPRNCATASFSVLVLLFAVSAFAQQTAVPVGRVADDALVIDRVAEVSKRDLPRDLLKMIVSDDIDVLRGKRADGTFQYATYERFEASRSTQSFSIQARKDRMETVEVKGAFVYRLILDVPRRKLLVRKNVPVWIERVDIEMVGQGSTQTDRPSIDVKTWLKPGEIKPIDLPAVARQATIKVIATTDPKTGYGNLDVVLVQAKIVDNADSPYFDAVASAKAIQRGLDSNDIPSIRAMAQRMRDSLGGVARASSAPVRDAPEARTTPTQETAEKVELQAELQLIEDLLTGSESERREGLDRLHQLIRRVRR